MPDPEVMLEMLGVRLSREQSALTCEPHLHVLHNGGGDVGGLVCAAEKRQCHSAKGVGPKT